MILKSKLNRASDLRTMHTSQQNRLHEQWVDDFIYSYSADVNFPSLVTATWKRGRGNWSEAQYYLRSIAIDFRVQRFTFRLI